MRLLLTEPFKTLWQDKDPFALVLTLQGKVFRALEGRRTLRVEVGGEGFFVKIHQGIGWREIGKNLLTAKCPVLGAGQEWQALERLQQAGVPSMQVAAFGQRGRNPAQQQSFIITKELAPTIDLEQFCQNWRTKPPAPRLKRALIIEVARITAAMHQAGVNHRDCYICHFLLHLEPAPTADNLRLSLIDLHRAQTRRKVPKRWRNKDLAGLYFSALTIGLSRRDELRFVQAYFQRPLREILANEARLLSWLSRKARRLQQRYLRKEALL